MPLQPDRMQGRLSEGWQGKQGKLSREKPEFVAILTSLSTCRAAREGFYDRLKILTMILCTLSGTLTIKQLRLRAEGFGQLARALLPAHESNQRDTCFDL